MSSTTKAAHTPGPWRVDSLAKVRSQLDDGNGLVADVGDGRYQSRRDIELCHANARLISAAPEMLEALEAAYKLFAKNHALSRFDWGSSALRAEDIRELNELPLQLRAAIAKGGQ